MFCSPRWPRPSSPMQPKSCAQSTSSLASYWSQIALKAAMSGVAECIENRLSVTTRMAVDAVFLDRLACRRLDLGMRSQAQIVLRCEVDARDLEAAVGLGGAVRLRRGCRRFRVRPQVVAAALILPVEEAGDA